MHYKQLLQLHVYYSIRALMDLIFFFFKLRFNIGKWVFYFGWLTFFFWKVVYELISLNESLSTEIYIRFSLKRLVLFLHNTHSILQWLPYEIISGIWIFICIHIVQRQGCIKRIHYLNNTAHGLEKSNPQPNGPKAIVTNIIYRTLFPLCFLL